MKRKPDDMWIELIDLKLPELVAWRLLGREQPPANSVEAAVQ